MWEWHTKGRHCWSRETVGSCGLLCLLLIRNSSPLLWVTVPVSLLINSESRERALTWREAPSDGSIKFAEEGEGKEVIIVIKLEIIEQETSTDMLYSSHTGKSKYQCFSYYTETEWNAPDNEMLIGAVLPSHYAHHKSFIQAVSASVSTLWSASASTSQKPPKVFQLSQQYLLCLQRSQKGILVSGI